MEGFYALAWGYVLAVVDFEGGYVCDYELFAPFPVFAWVACHIELLNIRQLAQTFSTIVKLEHIDKIDRHVELPQTLTALYILNLGNIIKRKVQILQFLKLIQILHLLNNIVLQIENLEMPAEHIEVLNLDDLLLMERDLFQVCQAAIIVLRTLTEKLLGYSRHLN